jgi:hypothetical protein
MPTPAIVENPYRNRVEQALGSRDPLQVLADTPRQLAAILAASPAGRLRARPFAGKWTPNEILGHLADAEWAWGWRIRMVLSHDQPVLTGYDQEAWVAAQGHNDREPREHLDVFTAMRASNVALWRRVAPADMDRLGLHAERGPESLRTMLRLHAGHDLLHLDQIARYLAAGTVPEGDCPPPVFQR